MFSKIISVSLKYRPIILIIYLLLAIFGLSKISNLSIDVLPDLNKATVSVLIETEGLAPEEIEKNIIIPLENAINGSTGITRISSTSSIGYGIIKAEFDWDTNILMARQIVAEKIATVQTDLPQNTSIQMAPISSIMGEVMMVGLTGSASQMDLRSFADTHMKKRIQSISGVSNVDVFGGDEKTYLITLDPTQMRLLNISINDVLGGLEDIGQNTNGGFVYSPYTEAQILIIARPESVSDIENIVLPIADRQIPIILSQVAKVQISPEQHKRGISSANGERGVLITISKQANIDTIALTNQIQDELTVLEKSLPKDMTIHRNLFRQSDFIENSISNISEALSMGALLIAIILFVFLVNFRTTAIILTVIPTSFLMTTLVFQFFDLNINTMTLGGLAMAIGSLVDDAIVGVTNTFKRLKENKLSQQPKPILDVVFNATKEVQGSILFSTILVMLVFVPLFSLSGMEGKIFTPLALSFILSMIMSTVVALTLTPVLSAYLLPSLKKLGHAQDPWFVAILKKAQVKAIVFCNNHLKFVLVSITTISVIALVMLFLVGKEFLPPFNEGSFNLTLTLAPGTNLSESNRITEMAEKSLLDLPFIQTTARKTGRSEMNEHALGVHMSEIEITIKDNTQLTKEQMEDEMRNVVNIPGVAINIGQPISHRIDFILSGVRSQIAIKIFGTDSDVLSSKASEVEKWISGIEGVVDVGKDTQIKVPQTHILFDKEKATRYGVMLRKASNDIKMALAGRVVGSILEEEKSYDIVLNMEYDNLDSLPVDTIKGSHVPLSLVADIVQTKGKNELTRENNARIISVYANVKDRDLITTVNEIKEVIAENVELPVGYFLTYDGQFEAQSSANKNILILSILSFILMIGALYVYFKNVSIVMQLLGMIPLSLIGAVFGIYAFSQHLSIASIIGFVALIGISIRNGLLLIELYLQNETKTDKRLDLEEIIHLSSERLEPVMMTTLTSIIGFLPLIIEGNTAGKELLYPLAVVISCGLITVSIFNLILTPVIFLKSKRGH